jgi:hypothetical protein
MKRQFLLIVVLILVSLFSVSVAFASNGDPVGSCPGKFDPHPFMDHEEHEEHHIGLTKDLNGDGWICVKHLSNGLHVHVDNILPLP